MHKPVKNVSSARSAEDGSIFTVLLGGIAMIGLISIALFQMMSGPLTAASDITQQNLIKAQLLTNSRIAIVDAAKQSANGDCDNDSYIEPRPWRDPADGTTKPTNGGVIPLEMGAPTTDPWGTEYGYCVWDVGPHSADPACGGGTGMLVGATDPHIGEGQTLTVLSIISAGPDKTFETTCNDYVDDTTDLITTAGDDIVQRFSYGEAKSTASSLWSLKSGDLDTAEIDKNIEVGENISMDTSTGLVQASAITTGSNITAGGGVELGDQTTAPDGICTASTAGTMRYNTITNTVELCLNDGTWGGLGSSGGSVSWPLLAPDGTSDNPSYGFENFSKSGLYHDSFGPIFNTTADKATLGPATGDVFQMISAGGVQVGATTSTCDDTIEGTLRYDSTDKIFEVCNGSIWTNFPPLKHFISIGSGNLHGCGVRADNSGWCWGGNDDGQVGIGNTDKEWFPAEVEGSISWSRIKAGNHHSCGIALNGQIYCWGNGENGEIGNGNTVDQLVPAAISSTDSFTDITVGNAFACGIKNNATAWCWGDNYSGKLGNGDSTDRPTPVEVSGSSSWKSISGGYHHTCGIKTDDTLWCWGRGYYGQLGNNDPGENHPTPQPVSGGDAWNQVSAGRDHTCGIKTDGSAWCWGEGDEGRLGNNDPGPNHPTPQPVSGGDTWIDIQAALSHTCGLQSDGTAWCWGSGYAGKLGTGNHTDQPIPTAVVGGYTWKNISSTVATTCGIQTDDSAWCWGYGYGRMGAYPVGGSSTPVKVVID